MPELVELVAFLVVMSFSVGLVFGVEFVDAGRAFCLEAFLESLQFGEGHFDILVIIDDPVLLHKPLNIFGFLIDTFRPETLTEAQLERVAEIQNDIEERFFGKSGLTGTRSCPSIGQGWGLFHREESVVVEDDEEDSDEQSGGSGTTLGNLFGDVFERFKA